MNREIKFRVWDRKIKCWVNNDDLLFLQSSNGNFECYRHKLDSPDDYIVQQYTGIKDFQGKEIYEGDIVEMDNSLMVIEYSEEFGAFVAEVYKVDEEETEQSYHYYADEYRYCKVIGNIFENKELIL